MKNSGGSNGERNEKPLHTIDSNIVCTRALRTNNGRGGLSNQGLGLELRWSKTVGRVCDAVIDEWENYRAWQTIAIPLLRFTGNGDNDDKLRRCLKSLFDEGQFLLKSCDHLFILPLIISPNLDNSSLKEGWVSFCLMITNDAFKIGKMASKLLQVHLNLWSTASSNILTKFILYGRLFHCLELTTYWTISKSINTPNKNDLIQILESLQNLLSNKNWKTMQINNFDQLINTKEIWVHPLYEYGNFSKYVSNIAFYFVLMSF